MDGPCIEIVRLLMPMHIDLRALDALALLAGTVTILLNKWSFEIDVK